MSLYAEYIKERENKEIIESDKGFATYKILKNGECYLQDIYVRPQYRNTELATEMTNQVYNIAKERGCTKLVGSVCVDANNCSLGMKFALKYGFLIYSIQGNMIFLVKNIGDN